MVFDTALLLLGAPLGALVGMTIGSKIQKKRKVKITASKYEDRFPAHYTNHNDIYPVSAILIDIGDDYTSEGEEFNDFEPWMAEVKRFEGNLIESVNVKNHFWLNLYLLNEKFEAYKYALKRLHDSHYLSIEEVHRTVSQNNEMRADIVERCHVCYMLMKADAEEEKLERTAWILQPSSHLELEEPELEDGEPGVEERALLRILASTEANEEMKEEAKVLLDKWRALHTVGEHESPEEASMKRDLETIKRIIAGKEL
jgi:hypothetical protein